MCCKDYKLMEMHPLRNLSNLEKKEGYKTAQHLKEQ
jgi:hypothetical protein